jgi:hypothetical protein
METNRPFMMRLQASTRELLDRAARDQRRSRASIVDQLIRDNLSRRYADVHDRLDKLLQGTK